jgi:hypothetical protein
VYDIGNATANERPLNHRSTELTADDLASQKPGRLVIEHFGDFLSDTAKRLRIVFDFEAIVKTAAYHFRQRLPDKYRKGDKTIVAIYPDFALLGDAVNASKQKFLTKGINPQISKIDYSRSTATV